MTLNQYIKLFTDIASAHNMVKSFGVGQIHEYLDSEGTADLGTNLFLEVENSSISGNVITDKFTLYCMDYVNKDLTNRNEVLSDTKRILEDVLSLLHNPVYYDNFFFDTATELNVFYDDKLVNEACGWYCVISLKNDFVYDSCQIPLTGIPITSDTYAVDCSPGFTIGVPSSRTLTINGVTYDLSADRTWTISTGGVPTSRILTINGVSYDLSADRSWIVTGGGETLAQTLVIGNTTGGTSIITTDNDAVYIGSNQSRGLTFNTFALVPALTIFNNNSSDSISLNDTGGITISSLSASRVVLTDASNLVTTSANITYDGTTFNNAATYTNIGNYASPTNLRKLTIGQESAWASFGSRVGTSTDFSMYIKQATPSASNYFIRSDGSSVVLNATAGAFTFQTNNTNRYIIASSTGAHTWTTGNASGSATIYYSFTAGNSVTQTASTAIPKFLYTLGSTQWTTGALAATQKFINITQPSVAFAGASTATLAATVGISGAAIANTNATITTSVGLLIESASVVSTGTVDTAYGIYINAPTGATTNYALGVAGSVLNIGTDGTNAITFKSGANDRGHIKSTSGTITFQISSLNSIPLALAVDGTTYLSLTSTDLTFSNAVNMIFNTSTGTKIGTATTQKIGFWNTTPIVQPTTAVAAATLSSLGGTTLTDTDTFDGYTLKQVVKALRNIGLLA